jgi:hypothetical protein
MSRLGARRFDRRRRRAATRPICFITARRLPDTGPRSRRAQSGCRAPGRLSPPQITQSRCTRLKRRGSIPSLMLSEVCQFSGPRIMIFRARPYLPRIPGSQAWSESFEACINRKLLTRHAASATTDRMNGIRYFERAEEEESVDSFLAIDPATRATTRSPAYPKMKATAKAKLTFSPPLPVPTSMICRILERRNS